MGEMSGSAAGHRQAMVEATVELLAEHGAQASGVREILARSGAPRGSVQHYFPAGKTQIINEAVAAASARPVGIAARTLRGGGSAAEVIRQTVAWWRRRLQATRFEAGCPLAAVTVDGSIATDSTRAAIQDAFRGWLAVLIDVLERDGYPRARAERLAIISVCSLEGAILLSRAERSPRPLDAVEAELSELLHLTPSKDSLARPRRSDYDASIEKADRNG